MRRARATTLVLVVSLTACASTARRSHPQRSTTSLPTNASTALATSSTTSTSSTTISTVAPATTTTAVSRPQPTTPSTSSSASRPVVGSINGAVITLNPGHDGGNASHVAEINRIVNIGTGTRTCDTAGTQTNAGYTEHAFNWDVAQRVAARLRAVGATIVFTRPDDVGWGPCIDTRAQIANNAHSAAVVSIHADGGPSGGRGFHVIYPPSIPGLTDDIAAASQRLAQAVHDAVAAQTPMPPSTYVGNGDGYSVRSDLGGLTLSNVPTMFIECANMRNATDAALLVSATFRDELAGAIAQGIVNFVEHGA